MSREEVEFVRTFYPDGGLDWVEVFSSAQREREFGAWVRTLAHPEYRMVWVTQDEDGHLSPASAGLAAHLEALRTMMSDFERYEFTPELLIDLGDNRVLVLERLRMRRVGDDRETETMPATLYEIADGKLRTAAFYRERSDALAAVGLTEEEARRTGEPA
jgi:ketosteroid isomerase-like protein